MRRLLQNVLAALLLMTALPGQAKAPVTSSLAWDGMRADQASTVRHGAAFVSRAEAARGEYKVVVLLANQPLDQALGRGEEDPEEAFAAWRQARGDAPPPLHWIKLTFDDQGAYPQLEYGGPEGGGMAWDSQFALSLEHADDRRLAGTIEVTDPAASLSGRAQFDLALTRGEGLDPDLLQRPARYQTAAPAATQAARQTYETFVRDLRAGRVSQAREVVRGDLDRDLSELELAQANARPEAQALLQQQVARWPDHVYASRLMFSFDAEGKPDPGAPNAKLAVCRKRGAGDAQRIVVEMWKFGADDHWWIVARSEDAADLARFPSAPAECAP